MTELFPRLEASNTAVGRPARGPGRPVEPVGGGAGSTWLHAFVHLADRASRPRIGHLNGHRMGRMPQLGCRRLREPTVHLHVYMSRQGRIRDGAARRARHLGSGAETTPLVVLL